MIRTGIAIYYGDQLCEDPEWELAIWGSDNRPVLGLAYAGKPTHMSYLLDAEFWDALTFVLRISSSWYFVAGGNGMPMSVDANDMLRALGRLLVKASGKALR